MNRLELEATCRQVRRDIINMTADACSGHPGGSLSATEILVALYCREMRISPETMHDPDRDRFVLSKGHAAPALYGLLGELGYFDKSAFKTFRQLGSILQGHPCRDYCPGVEVSTGSLGQGISVAVGMALGARLAKSPARIFALCGDGELQEGQVWEASMAAAHYKLDNFTVIVDHNGLQIDGTNDEVMSLGDIVGKFRAFGYEVIQINGHDFDQIFAAFDQKVTGKPKLILAETIKGKGVSFMENQVGWHGKGPNEEERQIALKELED